MKILLLGEYSNVHWTLAEGLRTLGHQVTVISNGDFWKHYHRDIALDRRMGVIGGIAYVSKLLTLLPKMRGYDVVQIINPMFLELKAERIMPIYKYLRKHNGKMFMGAFGMDYYWVHENITRFPLRYSDFNIGHELRTDYEAMKERQDWIGTTKEKLNRYIAHDCDGIIAGLYEYWACYKPLFPKKTLFIPYPIHSKPLPEVSVSKPLKVFIGISKTRSVYKGTDIMLRAAQDLEAKYPNDMKLTVVNGLPFNQYIEAMKGADVMLDQLYAYTPAMNALLAMSLGVVVIGGGEPENYEILHEDKLRPIINVEPSYESVYNELERLISHPQIVADLKMQGIAYISKHHDYVKVAHKYLKAYGGED